MLSPTMSARGFAVEDYNALPIAVTYHFAAEPEKKKTMELFTVGSNFPLSKTLSFKNKLGNMSLLLHYASNPNNLATLMKGLPTQLANYNIGEGKLKKEESKPEFVVTVKNNINGIACLDRAEIAETWTEIERIPIAAAEAPKPAKEGEEPVIPEQKYEEKERKRTTHTEIKFDTSSHAIPPNQKTEPRDLEVTLYKTDREFLDWKRVRNELEAYSYDMKSKCAD